MTCPESISTSIPVSHCCDENISCTALAATAASEVAMESSEFEVEMEFANDEIGSDNDKETGITRPLLSVKLMPCAPAIVPSGFIVTCKNIHLCIANDMILLCYDVI